MSRDRNNDDGDDRPRWRDPDEDDEPREWEVEPEEEKEASRPVLRETAPLARWVFLLIVTAVVLGGLWALVRALRERFGG